MTGRNAPRDRIRSDLWLAGLILSLGVMPAAALAQSTASGTIHGAVKDETGAALPGVTVTLASPVLQVRQMVGVTDADGSYRFVDLPAGTYRMTFELPGFSTFIRDELRLTVGFVARVDVVMKLGRVEESVTVSGQSPVVDVTTTATSVNFTTEILNAVPRGRDLANVYNMAPGVTTAGTPDVGGSNMANRQGIASYGVLAQPKLQVEGINITMGSDTNSGVYFNSDSFEEIQVKTSGNDAETSVPGISMVAVLKSGGNTFHGTYMGAFQRPGLQSNNLNATLRAQGLTATEPLKRFYDGSADLGGRIIRDKLWFYAAYSNQSKVTGLLGFVASPGPDGRYLTGDEPLADADRALWQMATKFSYQLSKGNRLIYAWQRGTKLVGQDGAGRFRPLEATRDYLNPCAINKGEVQSTINDRTLINVVGGYGGYFADYSAERAGLARPDTPSRLDRETGLRTGAHEQSEKRTRDRWMVESGLTFFPERFLGGHHEFKTGLSYYWDNEGNRLPDNIQGNYVLISDRVSGVSGQPVEIEARNYPVDPSNRQTTYAWYLKDTWRITDRLSANLGIRWEREHSFLPEQSKPPSALFPTVFFSGTFAPIDVATWTSVVPRAGLAWNLNGKTVVKTTVGIYNYMIGDAFAGNYNNNNLTTARFRWRDLDGNRNYTPGEVNLDLNGPDFITISGARTNRTHPALREPRTLEYTATSERELAPNLGFRTQYVFRQLRDFYDTPGPNLLRPRSVYNIPLTRRDPGPDGVLNTADDGGRVTFYDYDPAYRGAAFVANMVTNSPDVDRFHSIEWTVTRRLSGRWMGTGSFWVVKNHRWITRTFDGPNDDLFPVDETWSWAGNLTGSYQLPGDIQVAAFLQSKSGVRGQRINIFRTVDPDGGGAISQLSTVTLRLEPYGSQKGAAINVLNFRVSKDFSLGAGRRLGLDFDLFNVLNSSAPVGITFASGPTFGYATGVLPSRIARIGGRFRF